MLESEMTSPDMPPPRRSPFEWSLAALRPADSDAERPSFMFKAGQASRDGTVRFWRVIAVGCLAALTGCAGMAFWMVTEAREQLALAEAKVASLPRGDQEKNPSPQPPLPKGEGENCTSSGEFDSSPPPSPASTVSKRPWESGPGGEGFSTTPREIAAALRLRRDILTAGLGMIPDGKPGPFQQVPESVEPSGWPTPGTVFATPPVTPKKPITPPEDEQE